MLDRAAPGLAPDEVDAATEALRLVLPNEAKIWWGWHNGVPVPPGASSLGRTLGPRFELITLDEAVGVYKRQLEIIDGVYQPDWFPLSVSNGIPLVCDCSTGIDRPTPIRFIDYHGAPESLTVPLTPSLGVVIEHWTRAFDEGIWVFDESMPSGWQYNYELLDGAGFPRGLV